MYVETSMTTGQMLAIYLGIVGSVVFAGIFISMWKNKFKDIVFR